MPELSNIQTYEKLTGADYQPTLDRFKTFLQSIGLWNDEVKQAFDSFEWKVDDDGFVYSGIQPGYFKTKFSEIPVRPMVTVYTPATDSTIKDNWMLCELLIEAEQLRSFVTGEFHTTTYPFIKVLTLEMHKEFKQTGIYFTDEAQATQEFDGINQVNHQKLWQFDYAIIPLVLAQTYATPPSSHKTIQHEHYWEAWYMDRWKPSNND